MSINEDKNFEDLKSTKDGTLSGDADASLTGTSAEVGVIVGVNVDLKKEKVTGGNTATIGGGVTFANATAYVNVTRISVKINNFFKNLKEKRQEKKKKFFV